MVINSEKEELVICIYNITKNYNVLQSIHYIFSCFNGKK